MNDFDRPTASQQTIAARLSHNQFELSAQLSCVLVYYNVKPDTPEID